MNMDKINVDASRYFDRELTDDEVERLVGKIFGYAETLSLLCDRTNSQEKRLQELSELFLELGV